MANDDAGGAGRPRPSFRQQAYGPLTAIGDYPWEFIEWVVVALVLGSTGVWLVPLVVPRPLVPWSYSWYESVAAGNIAAFCIVLLAEMVPWGLPYSPRRRRSIDPPRGAATLIALVFVVIQVAFLVALARAPHLHQPTLVIFQIFLFAPCLAIACYLLCFRLRDSEPSVAAVEARENEEVSQLQNKAHVVKKTPEGDML